MPTSNKNLTRDHIPVDTAYHCADCGHHHCVICGRCHRPGCGCKVYRPDPRERRRIRRAMRSERRIRSGA